MPNSIADNLQRLQNARIAISNAIITKGGTVNAGDGLEDFATDISTIPGGGSTPVTKEGVNFYDYDGTLVTSMSSAQFKELESMPANPSHEGLTAQGWNWTLAAAKTYVAAYGSLDIGQQYVTSDGKTRIYIKLTEGRISPLMMLYLNDNTELDIDWGDNSAHSTWTTASSAYKSERHAYPDVGEYVIAITVVRGGFAFKSKSTSYNTFFTDGKNSSSSSDRGYLNSIQKITIGSGVTSIGNYAFSSCYSLSSITIPDSVTSIGDNIFQGCCSLSSITIPDSVTSIGNYVFNNCYSLSSITIPDGVTSIGTYAFSSCSSLSSITIPDGVTTIQSYTFQGCYSLSSITIPDGVTTINNSAFNNCSYMDYFRFMPSTPPTVPNSNAFQSVSTSTILHVPALTSNLYMNGTNYPAKASYNYIGYATYESGETLPTLTTDETHTLTWYATSEDAIAQTNPITEGNGNEVYSRATLV